MDEVFFFYRIKKESRNQNLVSNLDYYSQSKKYIYNKHLELYKNNIEILFELENLNLKLKKEIENYKKQINSKRYKIINYVLGFLNK